MASVSAWISSFRLHTLPLSLSTILLGNFLAAYHDVFSWPILLWSVLTTVFLQTLSNLANDYGDAVKEVDNEQRLGPKRGLQSGVISHAQMKTAILICIILSLVSGIILIWEGAKEIKFSYSLLLFLLGIAAIIAAIKYTMGKKPYGYSGFGDVFVFIFFGLVGVLGSYFLQTHYLSALEILPAVSIGCFSTGVLNLNNLRDRENDKMHGKRTLVVQLGLKRAKNYHALLLIAGMAAAVLYSLLNSAHPWKWLYLLAFIGIIKSILVVHKNEDPKELYPELKRLSLSTLLFAILFGSGLML